MSARPILDWFGGAKEFKKALRQEILKGLRHRDSSNVQNRFILSYDDASADDIRRQRVKGKRRRHIFNYERTKASWLWTAHIYARFNDNNYAFARYVNEHKLLTINSQYPQLIVKSLASLMALEMPEFKVEFAELGQPDIQIPNINVRENSSPSPCDTPRYVAAMEQWTNFPTTSSRDYSQMWEAARNEMRVYGNRNIQGVEFNSAAGMTWLTDDDD